MGRVDAAADGLLHAVEPSSCAVQSESFVVYDFKGDGCWGVLLSAAFFGFNIIPQRA